MKIRHRCLSSHFCDLLNFDVTSVTAEKIYLDLQNQNFVYHNPKINAGIAEFFTKLWIKSWEM